MYTLEECLRDNLCVDCDNTNCLHAGSIEADCPKWKCDNPFRDCNNCAFIKDYQKSHRKALAEMGE